MLPMIAEQRVAICLHQRKRCAYMIDHHRQHLQSWPGSAICVGWGLGLFGITSISTARGVGLTILTIVVILFIISNPQALIPSPFNFFGVRDGRVIVGSLFTFFELLFSKSRVVVTLIEALGPLVLSSTSFSVRVVDKTILIKASDACSKQ